ncbi:MAG: N-acetylmuramoyl-L-alanine amidase [Clostridia bacterium]|nr:N-acetylmuramoyl-L-alanine amidase [Clostridia bacterium]
MQVVLINARKLKYVLTAVKVITVFLVVLLVGVYVRNSFLTSSAYVSAMQIQNEKNIVIIDAGHGGEDPGAIGADGVYEKDLNLAIARELAAALEAEGFAVLFTRTEDKLLYTEEENIKGIRKISDLKNRCKIAAEYPNAIFVSIHMNSYGNAKYSGLQVYYSTVEPGSESLANKIQHSVKSAIQPNNTRAVKAGRDMYLMENVPNTAVLIECGFLTNEEECRKLSEKEYQKQLSLAIVCGIIEYRESISSY